jgi:hypothetical protein
MKINLLTFTPVAESINLAVYTEKVENSNPLRLFRNECPQFWEQHPELSDKETLFFSIVHPEGCTGDKYDISIKFDENSRIAKHYFNHLIYNYFKENAAAVGFDFVDNVEVWIKDSNQPHTQTTQFLRFSLVPQYKKVTDSWELLVSYNSISTAYNQSIDSLDIQTERYRVIADNEIVKRKHITPEQKQNIGNIFPIINRELAAELNVSETRPPKENKYLKTRQQIVAFAKNYLFTDNFQAIIKFHKEDFYSFKNPEDNKVTDGSNVLLFGGNSSGFEAYNGIINNGPFRASTKNNLKFFFICHVKDIDVSKRLYNIFFYGANSTLNFNTKNPDGSPKYQQKDIKSDNGITYKTLPQLIKQPFETETNGSITFSNLETAVQEIKTKLSQKNLKNDYNYVAIYISPVRKDDVNSPHHDIYFAIKEMLLEKQITSQVIYKDNPAGNNFRYHLPNIAIALLSKIGGIPWQLNPSRTKNDLIIGVGAFKSEKVGKRYVGSAFCFNQDGIFQNFDCYRDNDLEHLIKDIRKAIGIYLVQNQDQKPKRLIIHYYKTMGKRESKPITDMLYTLGFNIPVFIVTINKTESSDIVAFDSDSADLMPLSGTYVKVGYNQFLLYNNAKYPNSQKYDILFPVKVKISKVVTNGSKEDNQANMPEVREMLNQVYQFSRMYWKSVKQQNLPITIKYPEMVAEIVPHFSDAELPSFGKTNLWFL